MSFMRNDGFDFPPVFPDFDPALINAYNRINFAILSPIGRTHYSRAIMESSGLNDNLFITRTGFFSNDGKIKLQPNEVVSREKSFLFISDAHFYITEAQYYSSLIKLHELNSDQAKAKIEIEKKMGKLSSKGIRIAAKFKEPILIGCCIAHHHHPLEVGLTKAGYPSTDKSPFLFDLTYNKSLYPLIYAKDELLPPQIDWLRDESMRILEQELGFGKTKLQAENFVVERIKERLRGFGEEYGVIIAKGAAESGARNLSRFDIKNLEGRLDEDVLLEAAKFVYEVSKGQNVTIQKGMFVILFTIMVGARVVS